MLETQSQAELENGYQKKKSTENPITNTIKA